MKGYRDYERFTLDRVGRVLTVTITGTSPLNFIDGTLHFELSHIFAEIAQDADTDAVVLTASGKCFTAGGDVAWFRGMTESDKDAGITEGRKIIIDLLEVPQPIIAAVNGPAIGLGATIALFCDIVVAAPEAVSTTASVSASCAISAKMCDNSKCRVPSMKFSGLVPVIVTVSTRPSRTSEKRS